MPSSPKIKKEDMLQAALELVSKMDMPLLT